MSIDKKEFAFSRRPLVFMFGTQKSGTTWLRNMVGSLTAIDRDSEWYFPALAESFENHFLRYSFHQTEVKFSLLRSNVVHAWQFLICSTKDFSFVDKSAYPCVKDYGYREGLFPYAAAMKEFYFPDSIRILIVRDPRDVLVSSKYYFGRAHLGVDLDFVKGFVNGWARCNLRWLASNPTLVIRYEDLKFSFSATLRSLFATIGLNPTEAEFDAISSLHESIDAMQSKDASFYRKGIVGDWKNELSSEEAALIWEVAGDAMRVFGYGEDGSVGECLAPAGLLSGSQELSLSWLADQYWSDANVKQSLTVGCLELLIARSDLNVILDAGTLPRVGVQQKLVLILEVSWASVQLRGTDADATIGCKSGPGFGLTVLSDSVPTVHAPSTSAMVSPRAYFYARRSILCFELEASLQPQDRIQLHLFNGGDGQSFVGRVHALRHQVVDRQSHLAMQLSDLQSSPAHAA